jgi:hypothetical protein
MTTKAAILWTVGIVLADIVVGLIVLFVFVDLNAPGASKRANLLGQGFGMLPLVPLFIIWILWASRVRREREQKARAQATRY